MNQDKYRTSPVSLLFILLSARKKASLSPKAPFLSLVFTPQPVACVSHPSENTLRALLFSLTKAEFQPTPLSLRTSCHDPVSPHKPKIS
ncbi:hypothetical protein I3842_13G117300 [Carya illinoinensis]|uniref:Uncharacterized protein n=1 Tax=Carya illinoinensis TaxID=32201 RepID=A0A922ANR4_CARIL|nr:hypothetical protein I3842_13G117300 [Carya illinoinensis]